MSEVIIYHEGAYNIYSSISDGPFFEPGLTLEQLQDYIKEEYGNAQLRDLPERLNRAHVFGSSGLSERSLKAVIQDNHAGPEGENLSFDAFISKFLTL